MVIQMYGKIHDIYLEHVSWSKKKNTPFSLKTYLENLRPVILINKSDLNIFLSEMEYFYVLFLLLLEFAKIK